MGGAIEQPRNETENWPLETAAVNRSKWVPRAAGRHSPRAGHQRFRHWRWRDASLVAVSTGLLQSTYRDEAEAVIAHEISHVANGEVVIATLIRS